ncbi:hypothetical protein QJS10_CPB11g00776 [Acorus calamus]|uniref:Transposase MuDR plant domain-containing protein n=1 Tax=Acorus calamus TaxID=4465 RepID=A0AAV9DSS2_ACOCL|nr:hypothetical protein QJS10_CPB11g00776 [Acorus calamus]
MANHDLVLANLALGQNHDMGMPQTHDLGLGQSHNIGLGHPHEHKLVLGHHHQYHHLHQHGHENQDDPDGSPSHDHVDPLTQNRELALSDSHELSLAENPELGDNLELTVDPSQELAIQSVPDGPISSIMTPGQNRALMIHPSHELAVGQEFSDVKSCRRALRDAAIACHFEIQTVKSDKTRFTAKCASEGCPWRIHAAKLPGVPTFTIRTIHENHTCGGITHLGHQQASVQWVANSVEERLRENPHYKPKEILEEIHRVHGITLSYKQAWRGKERIMAAVRGSFEEGYRLLPQYCEQVKRTNPGSIATVHGNPVDSCFQRLFISFHAL